MADVGAKAAGRQYARGSDPWTAIEERSNVQAVNRNGRRSLFGLRRRWVWLIAGVVVGVCVLLWEMGEHGLVFRSPDGTAEVRVEFIGAWKLEWERLRIRLYEVKKGRRTLLEEQIGWFRTYVCSPEDMADYIEVEWGDDGAVEVIETCNGQVFRFSPRPEPHAP